VKLLDNPLGEARIWPEYVGGIVNDSNALKNKKETSPA
jgi:hypothetical protein